MRSLREKAHPYETHALEHWALQLGEEKARLDMLQAEVHALREQVRELVCASLLFIDPFSISWRMNVLINFMSWLTRGLREMQYVQNLDSK